MLQSQNNGGNYRVLYLWPINGLIKLNFDTEKNVNRKYSDKKYK